MNVDKPFDSVFEELADFELGEVFPGVEFLLDDGSKIIIILLEDYMDFAIMGTHLLFLFELC